jgi:hypothetical protein
MQLSPKLEAVMRDIALGGFITGTARKHGYSRGYISRVANSQAGYDCIEAYAALHRSQMIESAALAPILHLIRCEARDACAPKSKRLQKVPFKALI